MFIPLGTEESRPRRRFPFVTLSLVAANVLAFVYELTILAEFGQLGLNAFVQAYGAVPAEISGGAWLSPGIFTAIFLHGGFLHIGFNMLYLLVFGDNVEDRLGPFRYLLFYLGAGIIATYTQVIVDPDSLTPMVGASGAVAGVLGAYLVFFPGARVKSLVLFGVVFFASIPALVLIGLWFLGQLLAGGVSLGVETQAGVAYWAHIGGFLAGVVVASVARRGRASAD